MLAFAQMPSTRRGCVVRADVWGHTEAQVWVVADSKVALGRTVLRQQADA